MKGIYHERRVCCACLPDQWPLDIVHDSLPLLLTRVPKLTLRQALVPILISYNKKKGHDAQTKCTTNNGKGQKQQQRWRNKDMLSCETCVMRHMMKTVVCEKNDGDIKVTRQEVKANEI